MSSSSSSTSKLLRKHHVFFSFRGVDTRVCFTSHLYAALKRKYIQTFIDEDLKRGEEISDSLVKAIEDSMLSVIIFSQNYASSKWCLDELVKILECRKIRGQIVIPIFYHVDPSDIRKQSGSFGDAFAELVKRKALETDKEMRFRAALNEATSISGHDSRNIGSESKFIEDIVEDIFNKLRKMFPTDPIINLVGIGERIRKVESLLDMESQDVRIVGIWGMGGIGKTTIAGAVYDKICTEFEAFVFVQNVREELKRCTVVDLQRRFVSRLLDQEILDMGSLGFGNHFIKDGLRRKKVLIVFDDVDSSNALQELLLGQHDSFCPGSRILVTSRDQHVLKQVVDATYEVKALNYTEALQLFKSKAFKKIHPTSYHKDMLQRMVNYAKGNPLALVVLGSTLCDRRKEDWYSVLNGLGKSQDDGIQKVLRISYEGLNAEQKSIFLDIAYCFIGKNRYDVQEILGKKSFSVHHIISVLIDNCLITAPYNTLWMHDLLREMAYSIGSEESENPGKRRRLNVTEDIFHVLKKKKGTKKVKCICLYMPESMELQLESNAFKGMDCLEFLIFKGCTSKVHLPHCGLEYLPDLLRYVHWNYFPSKSLPLNFSAENLIEFNFSFSKFEILWSGQQNLINLRRINLSDSEYLTELPDLSKANQLQHVKLAYCGNLNEVPSYFEYFENLEYLNVDGCYNLKCFPRRINSKIIQYLSLEDCSNIKNGPAISVDKEALLFLTGCSNIMKFPKILGNLTVLWLSGTSIREVPSSIRHLTNLKELHMTDCKKLSRLSNSISKLKSLEYLDVAGCSKLESFPEITYPMEYLETLSLSGTAIRELHSSIQFLTNLKVLDMIDCKRLCRLPSSICKLKSLEYLDIYGCTKLESFPEIMEPMESLAELDLSKTAIRELLSSIQFLANLQQLRMCNCKKLSRLPSSMYKLKFLEDLDVSGCSKLESLPEIMEPMESLRTFNLRETGMRELPSSIRLLKSLWDLHLDGTLIKELPELPPSLTVLTANDCESLEIMSSSTLGDSLRKLSFANCFKFDEKALMAEMQMKIQFGKINKQYGFGMVLPGSEIPKWFSDQSMGSSITIQFPSNRHLKLKAIAFCLLVVEPYDPNDLYDDLHKSDDIYDRWWCWQAKSNYNGELNDIIHSPCTDAFFTKSKTHESDHMYLCCSDIGTCADFSKYFGHGITFQFYPSVDSVWIKSRLKVKRCGVHLVFDENADQPSISE